MFSIDTTSSNGYYIILKDGKEYCRVSKRNSLDAIKKYFGIEEVGK